MSETVQAVTELSAEEIRNLALRFVFRRVGDAVGVRAPQDHGHLWQVEVCLLPGGEPLGVLCFDRGGELLPESASPAALREAAERLDEAEL